MSGIELGNELARHLAQAGRLAWTQMPLGSVVGENPAVADVLTMDKRYRLHVAIYEVKVDRGDFNHDIRTGKYERYLKAAHQVFFATPAGLVKKEEIPDSCGLITRTPKIWRVVKSAPRNEIEVPRNLMIALLIRGAQDHFERQRELSRIESVKQYQGLREAARIYGGQLAKDIADGRALLQGAEELRLKITQELEISSDTTLSWALHVLRREVDKLLTQRFLAREAVELTDILHRVFQGTYFFADGTPRELRRIADHIEAKLEESKKPSR